MHCTAARALLAAVALALPSTVLAQAEYDFFVVDSLNANPLAGETFLWDINNDGIACGYTTADGVIGYAGILWDTTSHHTRVNVASPADISNNGLVVGIGPVLDLPSNTYYTPLNLPGTYYQPRFGGANDAGIAVGTISGCSCSDSGGVTYVPYVWDAVNGARTVSVPNARGLSRVNNHNVAVGWLGAFVSSGGFFVDIDSGSYTLMSDVFPTNVGAGPVSATDINDAGEIVGSRAGTGTTYRYAFIYSPNTGVRFLPFPGSAYQRFVAPSAINNAAEVVGELSTTLASRRAFHYSESQGLRDLNTPGIADNVPTGYRMLTATGISDTGWIVGFGTTAAGKTTGYVLRPRSAPCPADFNADGAADSRDFFDFLAAFFVQAPSADITADGTVDSQDFFAFLGAFFAGCP